ncbi:MAG: ribosome silencing factor [Clostridia bacterium]|nr:ribosome silencing factor [Deltaproteobacteria bacterium]
MDTEALSRKAAEVAIDIKAENVVIIDLRDKQSYADFLVVASGTSDRHVQSIAETVEMRMKHEGVAIVGAEGARECQWALIDMGGIVVHVFHQFARDVYDLESLWMKAPRTRLNTDGSERKLASHN